MKRDAALLRLLVLGSFAALGCAEAPRSLAPTEPTEAKGSTSGAGAVVLPALARSASAWANDINAAGVVVGSSENEVGTIMPVRWARSGTLWNVAPLGGSGQPMGINDAGVVIGYDENSALAWRPSGASYERIVLGAGAALAVSDDGWIGGYSNLIPAVWAPVQGGGWGSPVLLPLGSGTAGRVFGITGGATPVAVGLLNTAGAERAVVWARSSGVWSGPELLDDAGFMGSFAGARNSSGGVVGFVYAPCGSYNALCNTLSYWPSTSATRVPVFAPSDDRCAVPGGARPATDINTAGIVVGTRAYCPTGGSGQGFWTRPGEAIRLLAIPKGATNAIAHAVNDRNEAVGYSNGLRRQAVFWAIQTN